MSSARGKNTIELLRDLIHRHTDEIRVMMPGRVEKYYPEESKADIQPLPKYLFPAMALKDMMEFPVIPCVPIQWPRVDAGEGGPKACLYMPIKKGTLVMLVFSDLSLDNWEADEDGDGSKTYDPQDVRRHDITDAIAIPGIFPFKRSMARVSVSPKGGGGKNVDPSDIRLVLEWPDRGIESEIYLGGDTGDIVILPQNAIRLGHPMAGNPAVPQPALKAWLQELTALLQNVIDEIKGIKIGGTSIDPPTPDNLTILATQIDDLMKQFEYDEATKTGYGVTSGKVFII